MILGFSVREDASVDDIVFALEQFAFDFNRNFEELKLHTFFMRTPFVVEKDYSFETGKTTILFTGRLLVPTEMEKE